jgi:hypothetical protein
VRRFGSRDQAEAGLEEAVRALAEEARAPDLRRNE